MLWMYMAMLETAEQKDKIAYIYENYAGMMYHVAIGVVGEHYLAEDVVHETFLRLIRIIDEVETDGTKKLKRFLVLLTHSKAVDAVRKLNKMKPTSDDELANHPTTENVPEDVALNAIAFEELVAFVKQMDDKYRAPLDLRMMGSLCVVWCSCRLVVQTLVQNSIGKSDGRCNLPCSGIWAM